MDFIVHSGLGDSQWVFDNLNSLSVRPLGAMALSSCHFIFPKDPQKLSSFLCLHFPCTLPFKPVYHWRCHLEALISSDIILRRHFMYSSVKKKGKILPQIYSVLPAPSHHSTPETPTSLVQFTAADKLWATPACFVEKQLTSPYC